MLLFQSEKFNAAETPTTDRRRPSYNASETYEPMDESYYRRNHPPRPMQHPSRQVPLPEPPALTSTLGRPRVVGATAASTRAGLGAGTYRSRADSDSIYGGHVYDSTDNYYSGANYGRRGAGASGGRSRWNWDFCTVLMPCFFCPASRIPAPAGPGRHERPLLQRRRWCGRRGR